MVSVMVRIDLPDCSGHTIPDCIRNDINTIMAGGGNNCISKIQYGWEIEQITYNKKDFEDF